jgi:hypothetical protein
MNEYLISAAAELRRADLLREAEHARRAASVREPHQLRHRLGAGLIGLGRRLADEPPERAARPRTRIA